MIDWRISRHIDNGGLKVFGLIRPIDEVNELFHEVLSESFPGDNGVLHELTMCACMCV